MHGANRLASNSLLEGLVFAERVARDLADDQAAARRAAGGDAGTCRALADRGAAQVAADAIRAVMWEYAGIARTAQGTAHAPRTSSTRSRRDSRRARPRSRTCVETARLIVEAALLRKESRGGHYRSDFPQDEADVEGATHRAMICVDARSFAANVPRFVIRSRCRIDRREPLQLR